MAKAITKEYLLRQLKNFDDVILEDKYLQIGDADANVIEEVQVNGTALTPDGNKAVNVQAITGVQVNGSALTPSSGVVNVEIPAAVQYKIAEQATAEEGFLATYTLQANTGEAGAYEDVTGAAKINIPKDFLVKSVTLETVTVADDPVIGYEVGDVYIDFVVNTIDGDETATHLYLLVSDLVDVYTAGNGIDITSGAISVTAKTNGGLGVDANGVYVDVKSNGGLIADATGLYVDFEAVDGTADIDFATEWDSISI